MARRSSPSLAARARRRPAPRRPVALALAAALAAACAGTRAPAAPPKAPGAEKFVRYPADEVAGVADPHDYRGGPLCQRCHAEDGRLLAEPDALCGECHRSAHGSHPVGVHQPTPAAGLPLAAGGRVACHTCHDPHRKAGALRKPFDDLCVSCHRK
jgi:predicted CXXCH cytochrome family protein